MTNNSSVEDINVSVPRLDYDVFYKLSIAVILNRLICPLHIFTHKDTIDTDPLNLVGNPHKFLPIIVPLDIGRSVTLLETEEGTDIFLGVFVVGNNLVNAVVFLADVLIENFPLVHIVLLFAEFFHNDSCDCDVNVVEVAFIIVKVAPICRFINVADNI